MNKPLVIYHNTCADGFGAAFAAWTVLGDDAEYFPCQYGTDFFVESFLLQFNGREVYVLDFSFPRNVMDVLFQNAKKVVWLDHHASVFKDWGIPSSDVADEITLGLVQPNDHHVVLDNNKSGAYLAWEYFHPGTEVPMLIQHIDDHDRWVFALKGTKEINKALWSFAPWSFPQWQEIVDDDQYGSMWSQGAAILRAHNQNVESVVKGGARKCSIHKAGLLDDGDIYTLWQKDGLSANCPPHLTGDVGHELANQSGTFGLLWFISKDGKCKCSLRSNGDYDVSAIAKAFGGGGHRNAAGFEVDIQTLLRWLK